MKIDYHVHTEYSDDSDYPMEKVVLDAIQLGLEEICFTDHVDYGVKADRVSLDESKNNPNKNVYYEYYMKEMDQLIIKYHKQITIKKGIEFGIQMHTINKYEEVMNTYDFDFVLLSIHQIEDIEFWTGEFQKDKTIEECVQRYYQEL